MLSEGATDAKFTVFGLTQPGFDNTIYSTRVENVAIAPPMRLAENIKRGNKR
jgi:hypothetical protein